MSSKFDFIKEAKKYTEKTVKDFMKKNGLSDADFDNIIKEAQNALLTSLAIEEYFDTLTNGAVKKVVDKTNDSFDKVCDEFTKAFFSGK